MGTLIPLFPTLIYKEAITVDWNRDGVLDYLNGYFERQKQDSIVRTQLHKEPVFEPIVNFMNETAVKYWQMIDLAPEFPISISNMWANRYDRNNRYPHNLDVDGPANVTVVFYVTKDSAEMGNLFFGNPIELILQTQPLTEERRHANRYQYLDGRTGDLVCFPSWLQHGILPNNTDNARISIAANFELKNIQLYKKIMSKQS